MGVGLHLRMLLTFHPGLQRRCVLHPPFPPFLFSFSFLSFASPLPAGTIGALMRSPGQFPPRHLIPYSRIPVMEGGEWGPSFLTAVGSPVLHRASRGRPLGK
jgi:hypothetical protein